jgi:PAS domain S-box-containing protein
LELASNIRMAPKAPNIQLDVQQSNAVLLEQMAQFFDATTDAVVFLDRSYIFTFLNRQARELISPDRDILGTNLFDTFPAVVYENSPYIENYRRSMDEGIVGEFEAFYPEPLNIWLRVQSYPAKDGIILFFRDFTEEKLALDKLREKTLESQRQLSEIETVYRTAPIGLALFDVPDFRYLRLNDRQAQFFGLKPEQIVGKTLTEMAPIEGLRELFEQVARGEPVVNHPLEGEVVTHPGDHRYWLVSYFPVYSADGTVQAITAASLEITLQKRAERALIQTEKLAAVGRLASSIAHEINNPLEAVTNLIFLARNSVSLDEIQEHLALAERELRRISAISTQTLRFHKQSTSPQAVTAESLIDSVLSVYQGRVINSHVRVEKRLHAHQPVRCFEGEIQQVISNLVSNAIDSIPSAGGRLLLRSREGRDWTTGRLGVVITIADSGSGMSKNTLSKIFEPFFTTKGEQGTGLGMWVSKEILDRHHGKLCVRSRETRGASGTVFSMFLPFDAACR